MQNGLWTALSHISVKWKLMDNWSWCSTKRWGNGYSGISCKTSLPEIVENPYKWKDSEAHAVDWLTTIEIFCDNSSSV